jgi:diaminopimelate epimerase
MHGAGNDYIYINTGEYMPDDPGALSVRWSDRHTGIGADGLVLIGRSGVADFSMRIFNADGSEAMMCGNACRCIGRYVYEKGLTDKTVIALETLSGVRELRLDVRGGRVNEVTVDMGVPEVLNADLAVDASGVTYRGVAVSTGNPHFVLFVDDAEGAEIKKIGPLLERHGLFPDRTNVEFIEAVSRHETRMRVWERGSGITMACGTGACASVVAGVVRGVTERRVKVRMDGGNLTVEWDEASDHVFMTGGATLVFEGEIDI